jgi:hypothetical protein
VRAAVGRGLQWLVKELDPVKGLGPVTGLCPVKLLDLADRARQERRQGLHGAQLLRLQHVQMSGAFVAVILEQDEWSRVTTGGQPSEPL